MRMYLRTTQETAARPGSTVQHLPFDGLADPCGVLDTGELELLPTIVMSLGLFRESAGAGRDVET